MKQTINLGASPNDRAGDNLRGGGDKINDNFNELYLTDVVHINSASDFPTAVAGVRELVPNSGDRILYLVAAIDIDMGSDRFTITDGQVVIRGVHRTASGLTSTTSGNFFTCSEAAFFPEFLSFTCANAKVVDFTATGAFISFTCQNIIIIDCDSIFDIEGAFTTSLRTVTVVDSQTAGILWTGTAGSQINMSDFLGIGWTGTLLDLGTATFDILSIGAGNRFLSPAGTTILSGMSASGNINSQGRALVNNNIFNGDGNPLNGIDTEDLQWTFDNNIFADNSTKNTAVVTDAFLTGSETVTIGTQSVYVAIGGTNWATDISERFTVSTAGLITYLGLETIDLLIAASSTVEKVGGGSDTICTKIAINGTVSEKTIGCTENATPTGVVSTGLFEIETGDTIQLFVGNEGSTSNIIVSTCNIIVNER